MSHFPNPASLAYMSLPPGSPQASIFLKTAEHPSENSSGSVSLRVSLLYLPMSTAIEEACTKKGVWPSCRGGGDSRPWWAWVSMYTGGQWHSSQQAPNLEATAGMPLHNGKLALIRVLKVRRVSTSVDGSRRLVHSGRFKLMMRTDR